MKTIFFALSLVFAFPVFSQSSEEVILVYDSINVYGTLLLPADLEEMPVALIISGSGPTDRNGNNPVMQNNSLKLLAEALADAGIASLRYDKRGIAASAIPNASESDVSFEDFISDAEGWIDLLKQDERFNDFVVIGHSEGSLIGMITAQKSEVSKYVSIAGSGRKANDILLEQLAQNAPFFTVPATIMLDSLANGYTVSNVLPALKEMFRPSVQPFLISWFKYDPAVEIAKLNKPVLIVQGTTDIQVLVSDAELLAAAKEDAKLVIFEGMNHVLKEAPIDRGANIETYNNPDLPLFKGFAKEIIDFIQN